MEAGSNRNDPESDFLAAHWQAWLDGELSPEDARRVEAALAGHAGAPAAQAGRDLDQALRRGLAGAAPPCPDGLRQRVMDALDRCEDPGQLLVPRRFSWLSAGALAAASVMLAASLVLVFGPRPHTPEPDGAEVLRARLTPLVANVALEMPRAERCRWRDAKAEYDQWFEGAPELPHNFGGTQCRLAGYECPEVNGRRVMCAVYDDPSGDRFALVVFRCRRTADLLPEFLDAAELEIEGRKVLLWREGNFVRALVGVGPAGSLRQRAVLLRPGA